MTYLITASNSDISLSLLKILRDSRKTHRVIGIAPDGKLPSSRYFDAVYDIPFSSDPAYLDQLKDILKKEDVSKIIPVSEAELGFFANLDRSSDFDQSLLLKNPSQILKVFLDKYLTYHWLQEKDLPVPRTYLLSQIKSDDLPLIIKPRRGAGSKNQVMVYTPLMLEAYLQWFENNGQTETFVAQQYIDAPGDEYTASLCKIENKYRAITFKRKLQGGLTGYAKTVNHQMFDTLYQNLSKHLPETCFLNIQFRILDNKIYIFEINPRFSSTVMMRHKIGSTDFTWLLDYYENGVVFQSRDVRPEAEIFRVSDELVITNDDVIDSKIREKNQYEKYDV